MDSDGERGSGPGPLSGTGAPRKEMFGVVTETLPSAASRDSGEL